MTWEKLKLELAKLLAPDFFSRYDDIQQERDVLKSKINLVKQDLIIENELINSKLEECHLQLLKRENELYNETKLDDFLGQVFERVPKFAYKDKYYTRNGVSIPVYPNEFIQSSLYIIQRIRKELNRKDLETDLSWYKRVAQWVDNKLKWTSDMDVYKRLDAYGHVYESLSEPRQDCENHAFLVSSIEPEIGVAYGRLGNIGHAWNVAVIDNKLYIIETNNVNDKNRNVVVRQHTNEDRYDIHWIFTQKHTYKCKSRPNNFGVLEK